MGLDMYLSRKRWITNKKEIEIKGIKNIDPKNIRYITDEIMYWRKANGIHKWFVDNVQNGNDDCNEYVVEKEQLEKLINTIKEIIETPEKAPKLLPTQEGFFFGDTNYDDDYFQELEETKKQLEKVLKEDEENPFVSYLYQSSW